MNIANRYPSTWDEREEIYDTAPDVNLYSLEEEASDRTGWTVAIEAEGRIDLTRRAEAENDDAVRLIPSEDNYLMYDFPAFLDVPVQAFSEHRAA